MKPIQNQKPDLKQHSGRTSKDVANVGAIQLMQEGNTKINISSQQSELTQF